MSVSVEFLTPEVNNHTMMSDTSMVGGGASNTVRKGFSNGSGVEHIPVGSGFVFLRVVNFTAGEGLSTPNLWCLHSLSFHSL